MSFAVAPNFDAHPMVRAILTDKRLAADQRPFELTRSLPRVVWEECAARNDPQTWMQDPHNG